MADGKSPVTKGDFHILNWGFICKTHNSMVVIKNSQFGIPQDTALNCVSSETQKRKSVNINSKYKSALSANSNNSFRYLRDFWRTARGPHKMGQGAACGPGAAGWAALALSNL